MLIPAGQIINKSFALYRDNFRLFAKYLLILFVPNLLLVILFGSLTEQILQSMSSTQNFLMAIFSLLVYFFMLIVSIAFIRVISNRYEGKVGGEPMQEIKKSLASIWPVIWVLILSALAIFGGFILLIIPGIIFSVWFAFSIYAIVLDGKTGGQALKFSKHLVQGRWFGVLWRLLAPAFVFGFMIILLQGVFTALNVFVAVSSDSPLGYVVNMLFLLISVVLSVAAIPLSTAAPTILYHELKKTTDEMPIPPAVPTGAQS